MATNEDEWKVIQDPIHGIFKLHPLLVKIIDTPQFQRLRNIKQMGATYFVYPGACHNRFEHSIGTAHLAGKLARMFKKQLKNPDLISKRDVLCVEIAGLCHDLGHGPFSHVFDGIFANELKQKRPDLKVKPHEEMSCDMFDFLVVENGLDEDFKKYFKKEDVESEKTFIKEMINPKEGSERSKERGFLYEIISNKRNGVDVDKWDYFARDCHHLGLKNSFDHERFMQFLRVYKDENGRNQICARDNESYNLYDMFRVRTAIHQRACQHRVVNVIERMISDAFVEEVLSDSALGQKLVESIQKPSCFSKLDDGIFRDILDDKGKKSENEMKGSENKVEGSENKVKASKNEVKGSEILKKILKRDLYFYLGTLKTGSKCDKIAKRIVSSADGILTCDDLAMVEVVFSYGMKDKDPVKHFFFYAKGNDKGVFHLNREAVSEMLPERFSEREVQVFSKSGPEKSKKALLALQKFSEETNTKLKNQPSTEPPSSSSAPSEGNEMVEVEEFQMVLANGIEIRLVKETRIVEYSVSVRK